MMCRLPLSEIDFTPFLATIPAPLSPSTPLSSQDFRSKFYATKIDAYLHQSTITHAVELRSTSTFRRHRQTNSTGRTSPLKKEGRGTEERTIHVLSDKGMTKSISNSNSGSKIEGACKEKHLICGGIDSNAPLPLSLVSRVLSLRADLRSQIKNDIFARNLQESIEKKEDDLLRYDNIPRGSLDKYCAGMLQSIRNKADSLALLKSINSEKIGDLENIRMTGPSSSSLFVEALRNVRAVELAFEKNVREEKRRKEDEENNRNPYEQLDTTNFPEIAIMCINQVAESRALRLTLGIPDELLELNESLHIPLHSNHDRILQESISLRESFQHTLEESRRKREG